METIAAVAVVVALVLAVAVWGRAFCGRVCPFGYLQDLFFKVPSPVKLHRFRADKYLRWLKFIVIVLWLATNLLAIIPRDNLEFDIPSVGVMAVLLAIALLSIVIQRPFCKYLCPGAMLGLGNHSPINCYKVDTERCTNCGLCSRVCKMDIAPTVVPNSIECIRCGECKRRCSQNAIASGLGKSSTP